MNTYRAGIDIGSTTVKLVIVDPSNRIIFGQYRRHQAQTQKTLAELLQDFASFPSDRSTDANIISLYMWHRAFCVF